MNEIVKHINDTNASYRSIGSGDAKNTDLFLDNEHYEMFKFSGEQITVRFNKENLSQAILFIASILPRKYDCSAVHKNVAYSPSFVFDQLNLLDYYFRENGVPVVSKTQKWNARKDVIKKNGEIDGRFYFNGLIEEVEYVNHKGEHLFAKFTIRNYLAGGYSDLHIKKGEDGIFDVWITNNTQAYNDNIEDCINYIDKKEKYNPAQLQQIFYGAPGTGKSHSVKTETEAWEERGRVVRTTFHPDSDYSTFVGAYKPTTESVQRYDIYNKPMTRDGVPVMEQIITYEFVGQAFLQAYIDAWKNREEPEFLIIEEINRGNCAQIFGDLFQLLDRGDDGYSEYAIKADKDLQKHLSKAFKEVEIEDFPNVKAGKELLLPNNLYIRATMNTSDQSLFPIDSAFKRRWDWKYRPISNAQLGWKIEADGMLYDWWEFLERINREIGATTNSEDKKLGYFFCKAKEGRISAETFVGKVVFYLWNDVFKDYELSNSFFDDGEGGKLTFDKFYFVEDNETRIAEESISLFLSNLGVEAEESVENEEEPENVPDDTTPLTTFFVYNGEEVRSKKFITCMEELVKRIGPEEVREVVGKSLVITKEEIDVLSGKPDRERALSHPLGDNLFLRANKSNADHRKLIQKVKDALGLDLEIVHG